MCVTLVAACRRHDKSKSHKKNQNQTDALCHGAILINDENDLPNHHQDRCFSDDDPDPDIIPNIQGKEITNAFHYLHITVLSTNSTPTLWIILYLRLSSQKQKTFKVHSLYRTYAQILNK